MQPGDKKQHIFMNGGNSRCNTRGVGFFIYTEGVNCETCTNQRAVIWHSIVMVFVEISSELC